METVAAISNLSHQLQNRTSEVHRLNAQLSLLQRMYKDAREKISALKVENKELKWKVTVMVWFGVSPYSAFDEQRGVNSLGGHVSTEAGPSRVSQDESKMKRSAGELRKWVRRMAVIGKEKSFFFCCCLSFWLVGWLVGFFFWLHFNEF